MNKAERITRESIRIAIYLAKQNIKRLDGELNRRHYNDPEYHRLRAEMWDYFKSMNYHIKQLKRYDKQNAIKKAHQPSTAGNEGPAEIHESARNNTRVEREETRI